jgi:hypothetical protein
MRLIDADAFRWAIRENAPKTVPLWVYQTIDNQPTAYDVDKVVERLEKASYERFGNDGMGGELVVNLDDAIEIIKGGGENE